ASRNSLRVRASSSVKLMRNGAGIGLISGYLTILHLIQTAYLVTLFEQSFISLLLKIPGFGGAIDMGSNEV
ncbi:MAG: hypothetical protein WBA57_02840, partial [Elainellaceae cyanobacterium]